ncbi:MAG TPA: serine hydrolase [Steroidobacteraceae bacterium]|nr:serine hydrolase [Steroidobacteraceae bacterium]
MSLARILFIGGLFVVSGCGGSGHAPAPDKPPGTQPTVSLAPENTGDGWTASTPAAERMDDAQVRAVLEQVRDGNLQGIDSLVVARNGKLVAEGYFNGYDRNTLHDLRSTGKSFTSALTGIAVDQGLIATADPLSQHIPDFERHDNVDARKRAITVRNLLDMASGFDCNDSDPASPGNEEKMYPKQDWVKFVLDLPMAFDPGSRSSYCTGGVILLGSIVSYRAGMALDDYAAMWLFGPLDIRSVEWRRDPAGKATGGGGLKLRPRDAAKLGQLYLDGGTWNGRRVVPAAWVAQSQLATTSIGTDGYGYLWWKRSFMRGAERQDCFFTSGNGGNFIFVFPALRLVLTFTGSNYNSSRSDYPFHFVEPLLNAAG